MSSGVYFLRHFEGGKKFFEAWFSMKKEGHDQDGFNTMSRSVLVEHSDTNASKSRSLLQFFSMIECGTIR
jgi:hypothetical protein